MVIGFLGRWFLILAIAAVLVAGGAAGIHLYRTQGAAPAGSASESGEDVAEAGSGSADDSVALASNKESGDSDEGGSEKQSDAEEGAEGKNGNGKAPVPVSISEIALGAVSSYITTTANLVPEDEVQILAEAEGRLEKLHVEEGDLVRRGEILASLVKDDEEIALKKAQLRATNARLAHERATRVVGEELMSREEFDRVTMEHEIAQQELAEADWRLEKTMIRAPFGGRITQRDVKIGQHVKLNDTLFTISDFDPLIARIYLAEKDVYGLAEGRQVRITLKARMDTRFKGRIRQISPVVDTATGTVKVTVEAIDPPSMVRPGAFVSIDIVRETRPDAVLLPREAVIRELQEAYVFIANGDVAEKREVALGLEEDGAIQAISGVDPGEQVIVAGQGGLKDGSPIKIIPTSKASDLGDPDDRPRAG
jgi:membrane fusion protein (multidrug efflux system)